MKIAIQKTKTGFTGRWVEHCIKKEIDFELIDIYDSSFRINDLDVNCCKYFGFKRAVVKALAF